MNLTKLSQLLIMGATFAFSAQALTAADVTMKLGHTGAAVDTSDDHVGALAFKEFVEKESGGDIEVQLFPAQQLGNAREMAEQISAGALDAANIPIVFLSSFIPELSIVEMPYFLDDFDHADRFMKSGIAEFLSTEITSKISNVAVENLSNTGNFRSFYTTVEVKSAADLKGVKVRTVPSPLAIEFVTKLGAEAMPMGWGEVYPALQSGLIQGTKNAAIDIVPSKMDEVVKFAVLDNHSYLLGANIVSKSFLDGLTDEQRDIIQRGLDHYSKVQTEYNLNFESEAQKLFVEHGGKIHTPTPEEKATFVAARGPVLEWFENEYGDNGKRWVTEFSKYVDETR